MNKKLREFYLDFVNNYLTTSYFAEVNGLNELDCLELLTMGRRLHEAYAESFKDLKENPRMCIDLGKYDLNKLAD